MVFKDYCSDKSAKVDGFVPSTRATNLCSKLSIACQQTYNPSDVKQDAITALNGIQSNYATIEAVKKSGRSLNIHSIPDMRGWCRKIGYEVCSQPRQHESAA